MSSRLPGLLPILLALAIGAVVAANAQDPRPNIVLIMTDDQGSAQLGSHGDPLLRTPHLDRLAAESVEMTRFYVSPVRAPTRAALLTGRYNYRTGVVDTYIGRAMMEPGEVTIAEMLRDAGYRTGIFGKWHLGDNHPLRSVDQGFEESVVHRGGGIGQPSDPADGSDYFDPIPFHNGEQTRYTGVAGTNLLRAVPPRQRARAVSGLRGGRATLQAGAGAQLLATRAAGRAARAL